MNIKELNGRKLKKDLGLKSCLKRWHNKHVDKSGNFGYNLIVGDGKQDYEITGDYNSKGEIYSLDFGELYEAPSVVLIGKGRNVDYEQMIRIIKKILKED